MGQRRSLKIRSADVSRVVQDLLDSLNSLRGFTCAIEGENENIVSCSISAETDRVSISMLSSNNDKHVHIDSVFRGREGSSSVDSVRLMFDKEFFVYLDGDMIINDITSSISDTEKREFYERHMPGFEYPCKLYARINSNEAKILLRCASD